MLPDLTDLLSDAHVVALPMRVRFRGITTREALVLRGPQGWTEFSPFVEYEDAEAAAWLRGDDRLRLDRARARGASRSR